MTIIEREIDEGKDEQEGDIVERNGNKVMVFDKENNFYYSLKDGKVFRAEYAKEYTCSECKNKAIYDSQEKEFYCPRCDG